jgi:hypothetical protein
MTYPGGKRFAFTIIDDTDVATVENVAPVYDLLERLGMKATKTVWPLSCPEGSRDFGTSQTLEDPEYREFVLDLARRGFEIASHGATMESSRRERTLRGFEVLRETFGSYPRVHANHAMNRENLYWGTGRVDSPTLRGLLRIARIPSDYFEGHLERSEYWWGDFCREHVEYVRNLTFGTLNLARINPTMPYVDRGRPLVKYWFSAADAEDCREFNYLLRPEAQGDLERDGGFAIVATHFGKAFASGGGVNARTVELLELLAARDGWFPNVGELLDWLLDRHGDHVLQPSEWKRMQWRWFQDLVRRKMRSGLLH